MKLFTALAGVASLAASSNAEKEKLPPPNSPPNTKAVSIWNTECTKMMPICAAAGYSFEAGNGYNVLPSEAGNEYGCLSSNPNPSWFHLDIDTPGQLTMSLTASRDIDFIVWGPYDSVADAKDLCNGGLQSRIDCSYSGTNAETIEIDNAIAGKTYVLLVTNFAGAIQELTLQKTGGAATTNCLAVDTFTRAPTEAPTDAPSQAPTKTHSPTDVPSEPPTCAPYYVEDGTCTNTLNPAECNATATRLGVKYDEERIETHRMDKPFDHLPGGCFAKRLNAGDGINEKITKFRYNPHNTAGTNCGQHTTKNDKSFTKLCVCGCETRLL